MELTNDFRVGVPVERAWAVLTDVELIAPCMPGAQLQEVEGDEYRGIVKVKVGPITAQYKGTARFVERDDDAHKAVLRAEGRDTRGQGNANATITATLTAVPASVRRSHGSGSPARSNTVRARVVQGRPATVTMWSGSSAASWACAGMANAVAAIRSATRFIIESLLLPSI